MLGQDLLHKFNMLLSNVSTLFPRLPDSTTEPVAPTGTEQSTADSDFINASAYDNVLIFKKSIKF